MTGISSVDVGNYTCEVGGPQNTVLGAVTHQLFVRGKCKAGVQIYIMHCSVVFKLLVKHICWPSLWFIAAVWTFSLLIPVTDCQGSKHSTFGNNLQLSLVPLPPASKRGSESSLENF